MQRFKTEAATVEAWANYYGPLSKDGEYGAYLYLFVDPSTNEKYYIFGKTHYNEIKLLEDSNVVVGFF